MDLVVTGPLILVAAVSSSDNAAAKQAAYTAAIKQTGIEKSIILLSNTYVNKTLEEQLAFLVQANQLLINKSFIIKFTF